MNTVAGRSASHEEALGLRQNRERQSGLEIVQLNDKKSTSRLKQSSLRAAARGAGAGVVFGAVVCAVFFAIAGVSPFDLGYFTLLVSAVALSAGLWAVVLVFWNLGSGEAD